MSFLQLCEGSGGREALSELQNVIDRPPKRRKVAHKKDSSGGSIRLDADAPLTAALKAAARTKRYFNKTHRYLAELERENWRCCAQRCLCNVDKRMIIARSTIWGAKEVAQRRRDLLDLIAWCKVWAQGGDAHYELRLFGKPVCTRAFAAAHGETARTFSRRRAEVDRAVGDCVPACVAYPKPGARPGPRRDECAHWLKDTLAKMAQPVPNKTARGANGEQRTLEFLPTGLFTTLGDVYQYYCGHVLAQPDEDGVERRPASYQTFRRAWLANYFQVGSRGAMAAHMCRRRGRGVRGILRRAQIWKLARAPTSCNPGPWVCVVNSL